MKSFFKLHLILLIFLFSSFQNSNAFNPILSKMLQDTLDHYVSIITNIKGMSASVYYPGQGIWTGTSGVSYSGKPVTSDMKFGIASNSKLFVSTVILKLAENNILKLSDSLKKWLPEYPNISPNITIRQLLNHTSGITDPIFISPYMDTIMNNPTRIFTPEEVLSWQKVPRYAPGVGYYYSNINYVLAGMIAEKATGFHISRLIRDSILTQLNLDSTFFDIKESILGETAHRWFNGIDYHDTSRVGLNTAGGCAGSIFSTPTEMVQWYNLLMSGKILNTNSISEMTKFESPGNYGLGIMREKTLGINYWGHAGSTWGYKSKVIYDSCSGAVVCGLSNAFPSGIDGVTFLLYKILKDNLPTCGGNISGSTLVCQGQNSVIYSIPAIANATSYSWTLPNGATGTSSSNSITVNYNTSAVSGIISVKGSNSLGEGAASSIPVTVNPKPETPYISQNNNVLYSNAASGNQWYNQNGLIKGATNQSYTATSNGNYFVIVTLSGCSSDTSNNINVVINGINETERNISVNVYPNPVRDFLEINYQQSRILEISILNTLGEFLFSEDKIQQASNHIIDVSNLTTGVYFLKLKYPENTQVFKIIKE
ncbi:MAG: Beta-lactamase protein [Ignavibacteria bacterium]|nr:Beta-lactamase protein [Ignavibacteria bacterium]